MSKANEDQFMELLAQADPELWRIKQALMTTRVNAAPIPHVIRGIWSASVGGRKGSVQIKIDYDKDGNLVVASVRSEEIQGVGLRAIEPEEEVV